MSLGKTSAIFVRSSGLEIMTMKREVPQPTRRPRLAVDAGHRARPQPSPNPPSLEERLRARSLALFLPAQHRTWLSSTLQRWCAHLPPLSRARERGLVVARARAGATPTRPMPLFPSASRSRDLGFSRGERARRRARGRRRSLAHASGRGGTLVRLALRAIPPLAIASRGSNRVAGALPRNVIARRGHRGCARFRVVTRAVRARIARDATGFGVPRRARSSALARQSFRASLGGPRSPRRASGPPRRSPRARASPQTLKAHVADLRHFSPLSPRPRRRCSPRMSIS